MKFTNVVALNSFDTYRNFSFNTGQLGLCSGKVSVSFSKGVSFRFDIAKHFVEDDDVDYPSAQTSCSH